MRRRKKIGLLAMALACAGLMAPAAGAATVLDDFSITSADHWVDDPGFASPDYHTLFDAGLLGGSRELYVQLGNDEDISLRVSGGSARISSEETQAPTLLDGSIAHITWDATGNAEGGAPDHGSWLANLGGAHHSFFLETSSPGADRMVNIAVWDTDGNMAQRDWTLANVDDPLHYLSFASLTDFGSVDFSNIGAIRLSFLTDDISIRSFGAVVPVPPAVGLGLLGMMIVGGLRRRKKASAA